MYYNQEIKEVFKELNSSMSGLSEEEAKKRLEKYGPNEIKEKKSVSPLKIFFSQFNSFIVYILIAALVISLLIGEKIDAIVIAIILLLNAVLGFTQEFRAEKSIAALKKLASLKARVIRNNRQQEINAINLVPGDIILLETGDKIPADSRIFELINLQTQEAALTGESLPIKKELRVLKDKIPIADQKNMLFSGTIVTNGKGKAIVTRTGMNTEIGKIAGLIQEVKQELTPLQIKLEQLGRWLGVLTIVISIIVFLGGVLKGKDVMEFFLVAVSLAVAAIPEGLPAVVTISLALGTQRMIKRHALIRKLPSVETLGSTTVICTDKTGTLTCNEMTVKKIFTNNKIIDVTGSGYSTKGEFLFNNKKINTKEIELLLQIGTLNNDAILSDSTIIGDPTEGSLVVSAAKIGLKKDDLERKYPRIYEISFSSERKIMTTVHKINKGKIAYTKGAPEVVLNLCNKIIINNKIKKLDKKEKEEILEINKKFASQALRVLGFAYKKLKNGKEKDIERDMIFVGLQGMIDPPRDEIKQAINKCKKAGIKVIMITGDYELTAKAIAKEVGLEGNSLTGKELDNIQDLEKIVEDITIYARVNPEHKIKIVSALKKKGHVVAMTGDGINDAPALKKADIGIAMGITGTDVAKEASAMILTDDNFASIVNAVEEGRGIYDNIKKFVEYLLSSNLGEILTIFIAIMLFVNSEGKVLLPLIAIQILWVNLITDGLPAVALSIDPPDPNIMERKPRKTKERILSNEIIVRMILIGILMMFGTLFLFKLYNPEENIRYAQTIAFSTLMMFQMFNVLNCRSENNSLFKIGIFSNKYLIGAIITSIVMQILVIHTSLNIFFKTTPLTLMDWLYIILVSSSVLVLGEIIKVVKNLNKEE
jgi:Ca2+-transporting ATPase